MSKPVKIFIAFSHKDEKLEEELKKALRPLVLLHRATIWDDFNVEAGADWECTIRANLLDADIVLLLFSSDSLASQYFLDEVRLAVERHHSGEAVAIPVILRPCGWDEFEDFSKIEALPEKGRPVTLWPNHDEAFNSIYRGLKKVVDRRSIPNPSVKAELLKPVAHPTPPTDQPSFFKKKWKWLAVTVACLLLLVFAPQFFKKKPMAQLNPPQTAVTQPIQLPPDSGGTSQPAAQKVEVSKDGMKPRPTMPEPARPKSGNPEPWHPNEPPVEQTPGPDLNTVLAEIDASMVNIEGGSFERGGRFI